MAKRFGHRASFAPIRDPASVGNGVHVHLGLVDGDGHPANHDPDGQHDLSRPAADSGVAHGLETSTARLHDSQVREELLHGEETSLWADKGYVSAEREAKFKGPGKVWGVRR